VCKVPGATHAWLTHRIRMWLTPHRSNECSSETVSLHNQGLHATHPSLAPIAP
jgi:hypothetical protein